MASSLLSPFLSLTFRSARRSDGGRAERSIGLVPQCGRKLGDGASAKRRPRGFREIAVRRQIIRMVVCHGLAVPQEANLSGRLVRLGSQAPNVIDFVAVIVGDWFHAQFRQTTTASKPVEFLPAVIARDANPLLRCKDEFHFASPF